MTQAELNRVLSKLREAYKDASSDSHRKAIEKLANYAKDMVKHQDPIMQLLI